MSDKDKTQPSGDTEKPGSEAPGIEAPKKQAPSAPENVAGSASDKSSSRASKNSEASSANEHAETSAPDAQAQRKAESSGGQSKGPNSSRGRAKPPASPKRWGWWVFLVLLLLLACAALMVVGGLKIQETLEQRDQRSAERLEVLQNQLAATQQRLDALNQGFEQLRRTQREQATQGQQLYSRLDEVEQSLAYQRDRLRALSTTTREDWLLAEAEYLLKLANQRLLIERSTEAARGLLEEADQILRNLNDPQLTPVRRALAQDLTQLRLAERVDLEGLYLRLAALAESVPELPTMVRRQPAASGQQSAEEESVPDTTEHTSWWRQGLAEFKSMFEGLDDYFRIQEHDQRPEPLLPPDSAQYLQQNLRLMLERAQLAAMREEGGLYHRSLDNVVDWARRFYPQTQARDNFLNQVQNLAGLDVEQNLPDISQSLRMLAEYIDRLHKLEGVEVPGRTETQETEGETQP